MRRFDLSVSRQDNIYAIKYELNEGDVYDEAAAEKLSRIPNAAPPQYVEENGVKSIVSYVNEDTTLASLMRESLNKKQVLRILSGAAAVFEAGDGGVPVSCIVRDADYIYVSWDSLFIKFIALPVNREPMPAGEVQNFFRSIISNMRFDDGDTDNYVAKLLTDINSADFSIGKFKKKTDEQLYKMRTLPMGRVMQSQPPMEQVRPADKPPMEQVRPADKPPMEQVRPADKPQPTVQPPMGHMMQQQAPQPMQQTPQGSLMGQLGSVSKPVPHMIRRKTGEQIFINKPEFSIGKSKTRADYPLEDNPAISRVHCIIVQKNGVNYIKDNHSTNHTFLNGVELEPDEEMLLKHKSVIQMGDEEFTFLLRKGD